MICKDDQYNLFVLSEKNFKTHICNIALATHIIEYFLQLVRTQV